MTKRRMPRLVPSAGRKPKISLLGGLVMAATTTFLAWRSIRDFSHTMVRVEEDAAPSAAAPSEMAGVVEEIIPPTRTVPQFAASYALTSDDVPGWKIRKNFLSDALTPRAPWRSSDVTLWRVALRGEGHSSPIVVGDTVYLTSADAAPTLWLTACDLDSGACRWREPVASHPFPPRHEKTSDAASTPCSDGERVFVAWATSGQVYLAAFDTAGLRLWTTAVGPFSARWGYTSSPAWHRGLVIVSADNATGGFIAAADAEKGSVIWRRQRRDAGDESYSSPVIAGPALDEVVMAGLGGIESFSLDDGRVLWQAGGISHTTGMTPVLDDDICVASSGYPDRRMVALRVRRSDRTAVEVLWNEDRSSEVPYVPSPVVHADRLYVLHDDGVAHCRDLLTGMIVWKRRLGGSFSASPIILHEEFLCASESGRCALLSLDTGDIMHEFTLPAGCFATPVAVRDRLLIRTTEELLCFPLPPGPSPNPPK